jgi:hypothetical protein
VQNVVVIPYPAIPLGFFSPGKYGAIWIKEQWNKDTATN